MDSIYYSAHFDDYVYIHIIQWLVQLLLPMVHTLMGIFLVIRKHVKVSLILAVLCFSLVVAAYLFNYYHFYNHIAMVCTHTCTLIYIYIYLYPIDPFYLLFKEAIIAFSLITIIIIPIMNPPVV